MLLLTFRDLVYRRTRFLVVIVLGAVVFALLFVMTGLVEQFNTEPFDAVEALGADTWVVPDGISGPFTAMSAAPIAALDVVVAENKAPVVTSRSSVSVEPAPLRSRSSSSATSPGAWAARRPSPDEPPRRRVKSSSTRRSSCRSVRTSRSSGSPTPSSARRTGRPCSQGSRSRSSYSRTHRS
jgi:hypothetical protein